MADANGGDLAKELSNAKDKAPYVQPGPVRSSPDILNLDKPGKVIREASGFHQPSSHASLRAVFWHTSRCRFCCMCGICIG